MHEFFETLRALLKHDVICSALLTLIGIIYLQWAGSRERARVRRDESAGGPTRQLLEDKRVLEIANEAIADTLTVERELRHTLQAQCRAWETERVQMTRALRERDHEIGRLEARLEMARAQTK